MTAERSMSPRVRQLLAVVDSFEKLQILALTSGQREVPWLVLRLAGECRLSSDDIEAPVTELTQAGLLVAVEGDQVRYAPGSPAVEEAVAELLQLYREDTLQVVRAITQRAMEKIRDSAAHTFADAFVVRRKPREPDDG